jgi:hypothetical protein
MTLYLGRAELTSRAKNDHKNDSVDQGSFYFLQDKKKLVETGE